MYFVFKDRIDSIYVFYKTVQYELCNHKELVTPACPAGVVSLKRVRYLCTWRLSGRVTGVASATARASWPHRALPGGCCCTAAPAWQCSKSSF